MFYFLKEDYEKLLEEIGKLEELIRGIGREMGKSCQEGAETWHDNFAHEDGTRQQHMWSTRLRELVRIKNDARVISPDNNHERVAIGRTVTVREPDTQEVMTFRIGSYMVLKEQTSTPKTLSYYSPLAQSLVGAVINETREINQGGKTKLYLVIAIK